ncbi:DMT family transporter [Pacificibacter marinus]|uniref:Putative amino-acid metabolite efflux pump n=1 Tax=Pacificibacter marinus TaxID=658057 RepID=A0A1Y5SUS0_9RHOB|nr:DMT family transporter [Pacificibacter marinus]SEK83318.1 Permease of the drug/metabolite transporter (DMT) superfamily [Pacificibacter marinus]SLN48322.1 putative amino-acid metabolite efflux pump [Pacificibacter marinus]
MAPQKTISRNAWFGLIALGFLWGGSFVSIEILLRQLPFETLVALRIGCASVILWAYIILRGLPVPKLGMTWVWFVIIGIENVAMPFALITWGQQYIPSGLASILNAATALFGPVVATLVFRDERLGARKAVGVLLGFLGVSTVIGLSALHSFDLRSAGQLALIGSSLCYAFGVVLSRLFLSNVRPEVAAAGMLSGGSVAMIPLSLYKYGIPDVATYTGATWGALAYIAVLATALAYLIMFKVIKSAGSGNTTLVTLLVAPVGVVLGAVLLGETLSANVYAGFGLIAAGLLIIDGRVVRLVFKPR